MERSQEVDTTGCDQEPIRVPGSIQPHGFLLVLSEPEFRVTLASANAAAILQEDDQYRLILGRVRGLRHRRNIIP